MTHRTAASSSSIGASDGGPLTAIAGMALLINVAGLYAYTGVALCVFGYIGLTLFLSSRAWNSVQNPGSADAGNAVMILSWLVALIGGVLVGAVHWVQYAPAAYAVLVAYALAVLIWLVGRAFTAVWSGLFSLAGAAMLAAVLQLGSPPGADDLEKQENWTPIKVSVVDQAGEPIEGAAVYLDLVPFWSGDPQFDGDRSWWSKETTAADGTAHMALHDDPRFKRLLIRVRHDPFSGGFNEPQTIGGYVGHEDARLHAYLPEPKAPYAFQVVMRQRAHPDSAYLAVKLEAPVSAEEIVSRSIKVVLTSRGELPWSEEGRTFNETAVAQTGSVRDLYLSGSQSVIFKFGSDLAARPLTLHVLEGEWSHARETYRQLYRADCDPIPLGGESKLPDLTLPRRNTASNSSTTAAGSDTLDRR